MHFYPYRPVKAADFGAATATPTVVVTPIGQRAVRVCGTVDLRVSFAPDPAGSGVYLPAGVPEYFSTHPDDRMQIVAASTQGTANVAYLSR